MTQSNTEIEAISPIWNWKITSLCALFLLFIGIAAISFGPINLSFSRIIRTLLGMHGGLTGPDRTVLIDQLRQGAGSMGLLGVPGILGSPKPGKGEIGKIAQSLM